MMHQNTQPESTIVDVQKLQEDNRRLIACLEELECEASQNHSALTKQLLDLKTAYKEVSDKYAFSDSHYHMTLRHANNLQSMLDGREEELTQARRHAEYLQKELNYRDIELLQLRSAVEHLQTIMNAKNEELEQARRHADNLQKIQAVWENELMLARRHAENLQQVLDIKAQESVGAKLYRAKERVQGWFK